jgi:citrate synthase
MLKINKEIKFWTMVKRFLKHIRYNKAVDIDGPDLLKERLYVRGRDINDLIGNFTFSEAVFHILLNRMPTEAEKKIFDAVLVSFHGGFGYSPPTVLLARLSATTGTSVAHALSAGYAGGGKYHVGAIENAMEIYEDIKNTKDENAKISEHVAEYVTGIFNRKEMLYGYGHPLFKKDPRPERLRQVLKDLNYTNEYIEIYDEVARFAYEKKGLYPNIDGINSAILLSLGFIKDHGMGLFLLSRTSAMLAHVVEERTKEPFYLEDKLYPLIRTLERERSEETVEK